MNLQPYIKRIATDGIEAEKSVFRKYLSVILYFPWFQIKKEWIILLFLTLFPTTNLATTFKRHESEFFLVHSKVMRSAFFPSLNIQGQKAHFIESPYFKKDFTLIPNMHSESEKRLIDFFLKEERLEEKSLEHLLIEFQICELDIRLDSAIENNLPVRVFITKEVIEQSGGENSEPFLQKKFHIEFESKLKNKIPTLNGGKCRYSTISENITSCNFTELTKFKNAFYSILNLSPYWISRKIPRLLRKSGENLVVAKIPFTLIKLSESLRIRTQNLRIADKARQIEIFREPLYDPKFEGSSPGSITYKQILIDQKALHSEMLSLGKKALINFLSFLNNHTISSPDKMYVYGEEVKGYFIMGFAVDGKQYRPYVLDIQFPHKIFAPAENSEESPIKTK